MTNARVELRLRTAIAELPPNSTVQRIALADVAYPANAEENRRLGGFTLLVVTAVAHSPDELPPRVYFRHPKGELELPLLLSRVGSLEPTDLVDVFGHDRFDGLYAIPLQATQVDGKVMATFKTARRDFQLLSFPSRDLPQGVEPLDPKEPDINAVRSFAEREFPIVEERNLVAR